MVGIYRPGNGDALHLPFGQTCAALTQHGIQPVFQPAYKIIRTGDFQCVINCILILRPIFIPKCNNTADGTGQKLVSLRHIGKQTFPCWGQRLVPGFRGKEPLAGIQRIQAHEQFEEGAFAAAGRPGERDVLALADGQTDILQNHRHGGRFALGLHRGLIGKTDVFQLKGLQFGLIKIQGLFFRHRFGAVWCKRFRFHQALGAGQHGIIPRQIPRQVGKRALHLPHQLHNGHQVAVAHGTSQDAVAAEPDTQQIRPVHGTGKADVAQVGKIAALHPGGFVGVHQGVCLPRHLFFLGKGADDDKTFQPFLQEHPERTVCFLNLLVQSFQYLAERIGQQHHGRAAREKDVQKTRLEPQNSGHCAQQAHQHSDQPGHDLGHAARYHGGIRGQAVHPLAGVHRRH